MTKEEQQLLLKDISARLPYGIYANLPNHHLVSHKYYIYEFNAKDEWTTGILYCAGREQIYGAKIEDIQPYLRPMSSMTEEERKECKHLIAFSGSPDGAANLVDWLNKKMFAYRTIDGKDMFKLGLALEAPEGMYKEK